MSDTADIGSEGESGLPEARAAAREAEIAVAAEAAFGGPAPQTLKDVAKLLSLPAWRLRNALFNDPDERRYASFEIPKRSGGVRRIDSPRGVIRQGQDRLLPILTALHRPHPSSHGFLEGRGIVTNAALHAGQRLVLNVDLADFFPTINFGRVRGLFRAAPFHMGDAAATVCAQLCTFKNGLPQGAPTSPILSNYIATGLDRRLSRLARRNRCRYSRYADDLTFSTNAPAFPVGLCLPVGESWEGGVAVGPELEREIAAAGFAPNPKKARLQSAHVRQAVTGVTVNVSPNVDRRRVRRIRAMIHAWRKFGLTEAGYAHLRHRAVSDAPGPPERVFRNTVYGELAFLKMVRGDEDPLYRKLAAQLFEIDPNPPKSLRRLVFGADDFDVFISHATEDKAAVARPIFAACEDLGIKAFLDQEHIGW
ncbi:MAG: reverse transcriptase domain-containing protein, partial [Pseudomonadota bacterium]